MLAAYTIQPVSLNTSLNSNVNFICEATGVSGVVFFVGNTSASDHIIVKRGFSEGAQHDINGVKRRKLSVFAQSINNNSNISCTTIPNDIKSDTAILKIQGKNYII